MSDLNGNQMPVIERERAAHLQLIKVSELATLLDVPVKRVYEMTSTGAGPKSIRLGPGTIRFRISDIEAWLTEQGEGKE